MDDNRHGASSGKSFRKSHWAHTAQHSFWSEAEDVASIYDFKQAFLVSSDETDKNGIGGEGMEEPVASLALVRLRLMVSACASRRR